MKHTFILLLLLTTSLFAGEPWPRVPFAEVRAYSWPADRNTKAVILPGMVLKPGVLNAGGAPLSQEQVARLRVAITARHPAHDHALCYMPHNAFVFYNAARKPVAFVEICFACFGYRAEPAGTAKNYDLLALAALFDELKLPMGEYPDLNAYKKAFTKDGQ